MSSLAEKLDALDLDYSEKKISLADFTSGVEGLVNDVVHMDHATSILGSLLSKEEIECQTLAKSCLSRFLDKYSTGAIKAAERGDSVMSPSLTYSMLAESFAKFGNTLNDPKTFEELMEKAISAAETSFDLAVAAGSWVTGLKNLEQIEIDQDWTKAKGLILKAADKAVEEGSTLRLDGLASDAKFAVNDPALAKKITALKKKIK